MATCPPKSVLLGQSGFRHITNAARDSLHFYVSPTKNGRSLKMSLSTHVGNEKTFVNIKKTCVNILIKDVSLVDWGAQMGQ